MYMILDNGMEREATPEEIKEIEARKNAPPSVPQQVTMRQARLALLKIGKLDAVATAIAALPSPQKEAAQIEWEYSIEVERHRPLVQTLGPALGLSDPDIDQVFILAATL